jgi:hypothetical protein
MRFSGVAISRHAAVKPLCWGFFLFRQFAATLLFSKDEDAARVVTCLASVHVARVSARRTVTKAVSLPCH